MYRKGRPTIDDFDENERLYRRVHPDYFSSVNFNGGRLPIYSVALPDCSVNRSVPNGQPDYVLYDTTREIYLSGWGIVAFSVEHIPDSIEYEGTGKYVSRVFHVPEELNYYHSEIRMFNSDGKHLADGRQIPDEIRDMWSNWIRTRQEVVKEPQH